MLCFGDIHVYVSDFDAALRFWTKGLQLKVIEKEVTAASAYAVLEFPDDEMTVRLFGGAEPWAEGARPELGTRPTARFDILTSEFDETLVRLLEHGGVQNDEIETYDGVRVVTICDPDGTSFELLELPEDPLDDD